MYVKTELAVGCKNWFAHKKIKNTLIAKITEYILSQYRNIRAINEIELSILFTNNERMLSLNSEFRNIKKVTNVLSFPDMDLDYRKIKDYNFDKDYLYLGDIAFSYEKVNKEAQDRVISFEDHFKHLLVHSVLHLIGYNHIEDEDAKIMESLEVQILAYYNIKSPYLDIEKNYEKIFR